MVIRCPDSNNTNTTTGGTALPKFAIRGMLKTFGLHGVVLDVDSVSTVPTMACVERKCRLVACCVSSHVRLVGIVASLIVLVPHERKDQRDR